MRKSSFNLPAALCALSLLTALPATAQPSAGQTQAIDRYNQQKNASDPPPGQGPPPGQAPNKGPAAKPVDTKPVGKADMAGNTPLHNAAYKGDVAEITALLEKPDVKIDAVEKRGLTPLMLAAGHGHADAVKLLLEKGADPKLKSKDGATALHKASEAGNLTVVELLLKAGADPGAVDSKGRTAGQVADHYRQGDWSDVVHRLKDAQQAQ